MGAGDKSPSRRRLQLARWGMADGRGFDADSGVPGRSTTVRRNRLSESRGSRPPVEAWDEGWDPATTRADGSAEILPFDDLGIPHMEAFPDRAAAVLDAARAEAEATAGDLHVTFAVEPPDERPFVAYIGVDPPLPPRGWDAVLDTGGPEVNDPTEVSMLLAAGWEPDGATTGQWYRSWPPDAPAIKVALEIGIMIMHILNPTLSGAFNLGVTVFEDDPEIGRKAVGDATAAVLHRVVGRGGWRWSS